MNPTSPVAVAITTQSRKIRRFIRAPKCSAVSAVSVTAPPDLFWVQSHRSPVTLPTQCSRHGRVTCEQQLGDDDHDRGLPTAPARRRPLRPTGHPERPRQFLLRAELSPHHRKQVAAVYKGHGYLGTEEQAI